MKTKVPWKFLRILIIVIGGLGVAGGITYLENRTEINEARYEQIFEWGDEFPIVYEQAEVYMADNMINNGEHDKLRKLYKRTKIASHKKGLKNEE